MHPEDCQICGQTGQGNHFGVVSCRACAAFFRRSADSKWTKMGCLSRHCDGKFYHCKPCRLKRCRDVGMDSSKFQHNRDSITASGHQKLPKPPKKVPETPLSLEQFVGRPHIVLFCSPDTPESSKKTLIDMSTLISTAQQILRIGCESPLADTNLKKLGYAVKFFNLEKRPKFLGKVTQIETRQIWEFYLLTTARWFTHFQPFQDLEEPLKLQILLATWHVWSRLHKLIATALYRSRRKDVPGTERWTGDGMVTDLTKSNSDTRWMSRYSEEQVGYFLNGVRGFDLLPLITYVENSNVTETEMTFLMAQLCFQYASRRFPGRISEILDGFQQILANNLHRYYSEDQKTLRYSERIVKIMKINNAIQEDIRKYRSRGEIAKVFEVFHLDFSHPEMFHDTGLV